MVIEEGGVFLRHPVLSEEQARELSLRLYPLGDEWEEICSELAAQGFAKPAEAYRAGIERLSGPEKARRLRAYWAELAKEQISGLVGVQDAFKGRYSPWSAYRSDLIEVLRKDVASGKTTSEGEIVSPQIEPAFKQFIERPLGDPDRDEVLSTVAAVRKSAAGRLYPEAVELRDIGDADKYDQLFKRYEHILAPSGFTCDFRSKKEFSFRKNASDGNWSFFLLDDSRGSIGSGPLYSYLALALPSTSLRVKNMHEQAVAVIDPETIVPGFRRACMYKSQAEFLLAADTLAFLAKAVYARIDRLLASPMARA